MAETYGIYDLREVPSTTLGTLALGLRENSRIYKKINDRETPGDDILLLASIADALHMIMWGLAGGDSSGLSAPKSLVSEYLGEEDKKQTKGFASGDDFERARREILERATNGN